MAAALIYVDRNNISVAVHLESASEVDPRLAEVLARVERERQAREDVAERVMAK